MLVRDMRYLMIAVFPDQLRQGAVMRGIKDSLRYQMRRDQFKYPLVKGGRVRFSRRYLQDCATALVAEWPANREVAAHPPV